MKVSLLQVHNAKYLYQCLNGLSHQIRTLIAQYGSACLLGDKNNASTFNSALNESLDSLDNMIAQVAVSEKDTEITEEFIASLEN